ncbi:MAG: hypothetical protein VR68_03205 [Peptococcaceae bacterium BRH_c4a]|nr:MAG: hypothetical protein VR68_03205 [Peptococcaceae bacterium BRH_c4a]
MWVIQPDKEAFTFGLEFVVPNDINSSADLKKEFYDAVLKKLQEKGYKTFEKKVAILARVQRNSLKETEADSISKTLLDALHNWRKVNQYDVQVGPRRLIENDSSAYVASFTVEVKKGSNRVDYFIWEVCPTGW